MQASTRSVCCGSVRQSTMFPACGVTQGPRRRGQRMAADYSICLGTAGWGVWHSPDAGKSWIRHRAPFPLNSRIQALVTHPTEAHTVLAGGDTGLFVSHNGGARWEHISDNGANRANGANGANGAVPTIWSLTIDPVDPDILFAGAADLDRPAPVCGGTSPSGRRMACPNLRVDTLISIRFSAHLPSQSSAIAASQLGSAISPPSRARPRGRSRATLP